MDVDKKTSNNVNNCLLVSNNICSFLIPSNYVSSYVHWRVVIRLNDTHTIQNPYKLKHVLEQTKCELYLTHPRSNEVDHASGNIVLYKDIRVRHSLCKCWQSFEKMLFLKIEGNQERTLGLNFYRKYLFILNTFRTAGF